MKRSTVLILAVLAAVGLAFLPALLPTGPGADLGAASLLGSGQMWFAALVIFGGGLLTSLTPCVYPLIPITVGVFGARQADSRGRALVLTTAYVVGMGVVFSALGVFAALSGRAFGSVLGNQWVVIALAAFMVVLAASITGNVTNLVLNTLLIYGATTPAWQDTWFDAVFSAVHGVTGPLAERAGLSGMGVRGAAIATVIGSAVECSIPLALFVSGKWNRKYQTRASWRPWRPPRPAGTATAHETPTGSPSPRSAR